MAQGRHALRSRRARARRLLDRRPFPLRPDVGCLDFPRMARHPAVGGRLRRGLRADRVGRAAVSDSGAKDILQYEGSYELTPYYQADIESGRWFSQRFVLALLVSAGLLTVLWWITVGTRLWPMLFAVVVGSVLLR